MKATIIDQLPARIPPHNLDAERAVLGCCLLTGAALVDRLARVLRPDDFFLERHRALYRRIVALAEAGHAVDLLTTVDALREAGQLEDVGGPAHLALCVEEASIAAYVDEYVAILLRDASRRLLIQRLTIGITESTNDSGAPGALALALGEDLSALAARLDPAMAARRHGPQPLGAVLQAVRASLDEPLTDYVPSPIPELNDRLGGGLLVGETCYLKGPAAGAKTALALQWALLAAEYGCKTLVLSREMRVEALGRRVFAQQAQVAATALRRRDLDTFERARLDRALPRLAALPVWFDDTSESVGQIRRVVRQGSYRFVVVDYLQLVRSPPDAKVPRLEVEAVSRELKRLALGGCSVLALSAVTRLPAEGRKKGQRPDYQLRESERLQHDADVVLTIYRPGDSEDRELIFDKLRDGQSGGAVTLAFSSQYVRFTEVPISLIPDEPGADDVPF